MKTLFETLKFQFLMVRLKAVSLTISILEVCLISIPYGAIKRSSCDL